MAHIFMSFAFLSSSLLSFQYLQVFDLNPTHFLMISLPYSSFISPITFLFFLLGNDQFI